MSIHNDGQIRCLDEIRFPQVFIREEDNLITFFYSKYESSKPLYRKDMDYLFSRIRKICDATFWVCVHVYIKGYDSFTAEDYFLNNNTMDIPFKNVSAFNIQRMFYHIFFPLHALTEKYSLREYDYYQESTNIEYFKMVMKRTKPKHKSRKRKGMSNRLRTKVLDRDNYTCQMCGKTIDDGVKLHVDHKLPVSKGGTNDLSNLQTLCSDCNMGKFNHTDYKVNRDMGDDYGKD